MLTACIVANLLQFDERAKTRAKNFGTFGPNRLTLEVGIQLLPPGILIYPLQSVSSGSHHLENL